MNLHTNKYSNLDCIGGTVADIERIFSAAKYVIPDHRQPMTPQLLEAIIF